MSGDPILAALKDLERRLSVVERNGLANAGSAPGVTDHGDLTGLLDDDHPQYALDDDLDPLAAAIDANEAATNFVAAGLVALANRPSWVHGIIFRGNSWFAEVSYQGILVVHNNESWCTQLLRKRFGFPDNKYFMAGSNRFTAGATVDQVQCGRGGFPDVEGHVTAVYMTPRTAENGAILNYRQYRLFTNRSVDLGISGLALAEITSQSTSIPAHVRTRVPILDFNSFERNRITPGDGFLWANNPIGGSPPADDGQLIMLIIDGAEYSVPARGSAMYSQTGQQAGGWGEQDVWEGLRVRGAGAPVTAFDGFFSTRKAVSHLPFYTPPQNEFGAGADEANIKETLRFMWSIDKNLYRYACDDATVTRSGPWTTFTGTPATGMFGKIDYIAAAGYYEIATHAEMRAGTPVALYFGSAPARTVSVTFGAGGANKEFHTPSLSDDDVGLPISGVGIQPGTTIAANLGGGEGRLSQVWTNINPALAVIGIGGGIATITIDGAAPDFAGGVRINGGTSAQVNTDRVSGFNGNGRVGLNRPEPGSPAVRMFPMAAVITGLPAGIHHVRVTVTSFPPGPALSRFYQNGWAYEAFAPSPPIIPLKQPVLMITASVYARTMHGAAGRVNIALCNQWLDELAAEFEATDRGNIEFVPLDELMDEDPLLFDAGGSHPSPLGHEVIEQGMWDATQRLDQRLIRAT